MSAATADDRSDQRGGIPMRLHGLDLSYFTGKVHACLRAKGLEHEFIEMDTRDFRRCAAQTGVAQMPQLELPDGRWLTDSSAIVEHFEQACPEPTLYPTQGALCFIAHLLAACRALDVGATGVHSDAVQGASTKLGRAPSEAAQRRDASNSPPARRVGAKRGVCVVAPLGHGPAMAGAPRLASIPVWFQRVPRAKSDRLLGQRMRLEPVLQSEINARLPASARGPKGLHNIG